MEIESRGLPIHTDATVKIRPRIFLEGNWFVELQPGSPSAPTLSSGAHDPDHADLGPGAARPGARRAQHRHARQPAGLPDRLRRRADAPSRRQAEDAEQDPEVRGAERGAGAQQGLRRAAPSAAARRRGRQPGDQRHRTARPLEAGREHRQSDRRAERARAAARRTDRQLQHLLRARSRRSRRACAATVAELPSALRNIDHGLRELDASFAADARLRAPTSSRASKRRRRRSRRRCRGSNRSRPRWRRTSSAAWPRGCEAATPPLAQLTAEQTPFYKQTELFNKCLTKVLYPAGNTKLQDGAATTGVEDYKEFWYASPASPGIGQNFDGNGTMTPLPRRQRRPDAALAAGLGSLGSNIKRPASCSRTPRCRRRARARRSPATEPRIQAARALLHAGAARIQRPAVAGPGGRERMMSPDRRTRTNTRAGSASATRSSATARRSSRWSTMVVIAAAVGGYILAHENLKLPGWVPVFGRRLLHAEGRIPDGAGGHARAGPGGHDRRREDRRNRERRPAQRRRAR